jgi:hypothetical protein
MRLLKKKKCVRCGAKAIGSIKSITVIDPLMNVYDYPFNSKGYTCSPCVSYTEKLLVEAIKKGSPSIRPYHLEVRSNLEHLGGGFIEYIKSSCSKIYSRYKRRK